MVRTDVLLMILNPNVCSSTLVECFLVYAATGRANIHWLLILYARPLLYFTLHKYTHGADTILASILYKKRLRTSKGKWTVQAVKWSSQDLNLGSLTPVTLVC